MATHHEDLLRHSLIYASLRINHLIDPLCSNRRHPDFERICLFGRNLLCDRSFVIVTQKQGEEALSAIGMLDYISFEKK